MRTLVAFAIILLAAAVAISCGEVSEQPPGSPTPVPAAVAQPSGGPGQRVADQGPGHISRGQSHPPYNSIPATSGWHFGQPLAPARWGIHDEPLSDEVLLHNLEHGGIGVQYDCPDGCKELVDQLADIVRRALDQDLKVIMSPYPGMETRIALTAWAFIDRLDEYDEARVTEFIQAHESSPNAPEPNAR